MAPDPRLLQAAITMSMMPRTPAQGNYGTDQLTGPDQINHGGPDQVGGWKWYWNSPMASKGPNDIGPGGYNGDPRSLEKLKIPKGSTLA